MSGEPNTAAIPARVGGKAVTVGQVLTLVAFLLDSPYSLTVSGYYFQRYQVRDEMTKQVTERIEGFRLER